MIDIIAGVILFGAAAVLATYAAAESIRQIRAGRAVEPFTPPENMDAWQERIDSAWMLAIAYTLMAAGAWGLLVFGIITELLT